MSNSIAPIDNMYDHEVKQIHALYAQIYEKWARKPNTRANLMEFHKEVINKFEEIGFDVDVDFLEYLDDLIAGVSKPRPPILTVIGRTNPLHIFDHEMKAFEVKESRKKGEG